MKREIKLKFWLGHIKKMTYGHDIGAILHGFNWDMTDDIIPLQFTGLTDKEGKDIYEGDVYRTTIEYDEGDNTYYVVCVWIKEICCFGWLNVGDYINYTDNGFDVLDDSGIPFNCDINEAKMITVIGNIYEKPNFLLL